MLKLTRIAHHIQPMCHSIGEQNPTRAQPEQEETNLIQTLMMFLQTGRKKILHHNHKQRKYMHEHRNNTIKFSPKTHIMMELQGYFTIYSSMRYIS